FGAGARGIMRVSANGGKPETLSAVKNGELAHGPQLLPDGRHVLFTLGTGNNWDNAQIAVQSLDSRERKILVQGGSDARVVSTGHLVYGFGGVVFAIRFDRKRL